MASGSEGAEAAATDNDSGANGGEAKSLPELVAEMATDIAELRTIVLAAAKHFRVDVDDPRPEWTPVFHDTLGSRAKVDLESVRPRDEGYDEEAIISRLIARLPGEDGIASSISWDRSLGLDPGKLKAKVWPRNWTADANGLQPIVEWELDDSISRHVQEFGYTADGYPCGLPTEWEAGNMRSRQGGVVSFREHVLVTNKSEPPTPSWAGQRFGKEWAFPVHENTDPSNIIVAVCQLLDSEGFARHMERPTTHVALDFIDGFWGLWRPWVPSMSRLAWSRMAEKGLPLVPKDLVFQCHMRFLNASFYRLSKPPHLTRVFGRVQVPNAQDPLCVCERRLSVAVRTSFDLDLPVFSLVSLTDGEVRHGPWHLSGLLDRLEPLDHVKRWKEMGIRPSVRSTGMAAFAFRIRTMCTLWKAGWDQMLNQIKLECVFAVQVEQILSRQERRRFMYDDSELTVSELYFFISQLLRFAAEWIRESVEDMRQLVRQLDCYHYSIERRKGDPEGSFLPDSLEAQQSSIQAFRLNWDAVLSYHQELADRLLAQIAKQQEEVESLRGELFRATAVSEATKSKQLNHYILVFTVVTIFYLPLSFVAALYALGMFSWEDPGQKTSFVVTTVLVAGSTYGFAGFLVWSVRQPKRWRMWWKRENLAKSVSKLFKQLRVRRGRAAESEAEDSEPEGLA